MAKTQYWFNVDAPYQLLTYNLYSNNKVVYDKAKGTSKQGFTFEVEIPGLEGVRFQLTRRDMHACE